MKKVMWLAFKSEPYAEILSPLGPACNDKLSKVSIFAEGKVPQENEKIKND